MGRSRKAPRPAHRTRGWIEEKGWGEGVPGDGDQAPHAAVTHFLGTTSLDVLRGNRPVARRWRRWVVDGSSRPIPRKASSRSLEAIPSRLSAPKRIEVTASRISDVIATNSMVASIWVYSILDATRGAAE